MTILVDLLNEYNQSEKNIFNNSEGVELHTGFVQHTHLLLVVCRMPLLGTSSSSFLCSEIKEGR
jgi:hypothetical protein